MTVLTFAVYVAVGNTLTPAVAFTSLALFGVLRLPLFMLPNTISQVVTANVSLGRYEFERKRWLDALLSPVAGGRLKDFLCADEGALEPNPIITEVRLSPCYVCVGLTPTLLPFAVSARGPTGDCAYSN